MSHDTHARPASAAGAFAQIIGKIADTTDWNHDDWQALMARLAAYDVPVASLTLGEMSAAIEAVRAAHKAAQA